LIRLQLRQGDVMVLGLPRAEEPASEKQAIEWLWAACRSDRVAVYLILEPLAGVDMFSVRAYHWTAPYGDPFDLANASFFCEGQIIGRDNTGFEGMLRRIAHDCPKQVFILGSRFDMGRSFPPDPAPYERQRQRLDDVLRKAGTDFVQLTPMP
jgi:hypothetical protein